MNKTICIKCRDSVEYIIKEEKDIAVVKGEKINYNRKVAYCSKCGTRVWVEEVDAYNATAHIEQYCKIHELITISEIKEILEKYDIGQKPLAAILGWGEITIIRFMKGMIPSVEYSRTLRELANPIVFLQTLAKNKDKISSSAYNRAIRKFNSLMLNIEFYYAFPTTCMYEYGYNSSKKTQSNYGGVTCGKQLCTC